MNHSDEPPDTPDNRRPIIVLLVDDQPFVGAAIKRLLAGDTGIALHCCHAAVEAVTLAHQIRPAVILQDLVMPDIDGLTLVGLFRRDPATADTAVIVLSGNDDPETRAQAHAAGAHDFLVKLPGRDQLLDCIRRHAIGQTTTSLAPVETGTAVDPDNDCRLDPSVMADLLDVSTEFAMDLVDLFIEDATVRVAALRTAAGLDDALELQTTAHCLKGSAMTMGARKLATLCARLETHATALADRKTTSTLVAAIGDEFGEVSIALSRDPRTAHTIAFDARGTSA